LSYDRFVDSTKCPNCARLEARVAQLEAENAELRAIIRQLIERNNALEARVKELEARLKMNSTNSSKPPSSTYRASPRKGPGATGFRAAIRRAGARGIRGRRSTLKDPPT